MDDFIYIYGSNGPQLHVDCWNCRYTRRLSNTRRNRDESDARLAATTPRAIPPASTMAPVTSATAEQQPSLANQWDIPGLMRYPVTRMAAHQTRGPATIAMPVPVDPFPERLAPMHYPPLPPLPQSVGPAAGFTGNAQPPGTMQVPAGQPIQFHGQRSAQVYGSGGPAAVTSTISPATHPTYYATLERLRALGPPLTKVRGSDGPAIATSASPVQYSSRAATSQPLHPYGQPPAHVRGSGGPADVTSTLSPATHPTYYDTLQLLWSLGPPPALAGRATDNAVQGSVPAVPQSHQTTAPGGSLPVAGSSSTSTHPSAKRKRSPRGNEDGRKEGGK